MKCSTCGRERVNYKARWFPDGSKQEGCNKCVGDVAAGHIPEKFGDCPAGVKMPFGFLSKAQERESRERVGYVDNHGDCYPIPIRETRRRSVVMQGLRQ